MTREEAQALLARVSKPRVRMAVDATGGPIVREFEPGKVPPMWQKKGRVLESGDNTQDTPLATAIGRNFTSATAGALQGAAQMAPMLMPEAGAAARLATLFGASGGADVAGDVIQGRKPNLGKSALVGGVSAAIQAPFEGAAAVLSHLAKPTMKAAIGNALPKTEDALLANKLNVSNASLDKAQSMIDQHVADAQAAIKNWAGKFSWRPLYKAIRAEHKLAVKSDVVSGDTEKALSDAMDFLLGKIGPHQVQTPASTILAPAMGGLRAGTPAIPAATVQVPGKELSASDVDLIKKFAQEEASKIYEARLANNNKVPTSDEIAFKAIASGAKNMLETIPDVALANGKASQLINSRDAIFDALKRAHGGGTSALLGSALAIPAAAAHNPLGAAAGVAAGAAHYAATSPSIMSRLALGMDNPATQRAVRNASRYTASLAADALASKRNQ